MWKWLIKTIAPEPVPPIKKEKPIKTRQAVPYSEKLQYALDEMMELQRAEGFAPYKAVPQVPKVKSKGATNFALDNQLSTKAQSQGGNAVLLPQAYWYASQTFIGYQQMAFMSQQWLVKKCCLMPAKDAVRNGYDITVNDGTDVDPEVLDAIRKADVRFRLNHNMIQLVDQGRIFGIRIAMFIVDSLDKDYYYKPFNPDGVKPGSYKGISQIDPYWCTPQLDTEAAGAPASIHFYEPTWWNVAGRSVHRTHLVIYRTDEVPDILKPMYLYGGVSVTQKIYERVYAAERTANEAPLLALTKRTDVLKTDLSQAEANAPVFFGGIETWVANRDNYGVKVIGLEDEFNQVDTSLTDLDAVIMTQYQLVAAAAEIPATKLLGTTPKGFNATGEYEEAAYHEMLESIQTHDLTPLLERHHLLLIRSEIAPKFGIKPFGTSIVWKTLDAMTAKEQAEVNLIKAQTGAALVQSGSIDGYDERERLIADPESGYSGMMIDDIVSDPEENDDDVTPQETGETKK